MIHGVLCPECRGDRKKMLVCQCCFGSGIIAAEYEEQATKEAVRRMTARDRTRRSIIAWASIFGIVALAGILAAAFYMSGGRP